VLGRRQALKFGFEAVDGVQPVRTEVIPVPSWICAAETWLPTQYPIGLRFHWEQICWTWHSRSCPMAMALSCTPIRAGSTRTSTTRECLESSGSSPNGIIAPRPFCSPVNTEEAQMMNDFPSRAVVENLRRRKRFAAVVIATILPLCYTHLGNQQKSPCFERIIL
jgi:hypothetical protein